MNAKYFEQINDISLFQNSARIIRSSVFGMDSNGKVKELLKFAANNLCITNVDIQVITW